MAWDSNPCQVGNIPNLHRSLILEANSRFARQVDTKSLAWMGRSMQDMGQSAKQRVSASFTWDDYGSQIVRQYRRILPC